MVLGVTGGIASGKSTVLEMLRRMGAEVASADDYSRELLQPGQAPYEAVIRQFGDGILRDDGSVDRGALARRIFADPEERRRLEAILHPPILERLQQRVERFRQAPSNRDRVLALEIPLLYEVGCEGLVDRVLVVTSEQEKLFGRLKHRTRWPDGQVRAALASQLPLSHKAALADFVVSTDGTLEDTESQVAEVWRKLGTHEV